MSKTRVEISKLIFERLKENMEHLSSQYDTSKFDIGYFFIDDLLPAELAKQCFEVFPKASQMKCLKSLREYKYVSAQMDKHHELLENILYAFQDEKIIKLIGEICNIDSLYADETLYAGGLSLMKKKNFLHPHLDNSHDAERERWRVLNLLYYVTPEWSTKNGGHLELWPNGPKKEPIIIESKFNRLVVMATHSSSWHSVNEVLIENNRCCISNYYFSDLPLKETDKFHITKFRGRPEDRFTNFILDFDSSLRMLIRKVFKKGIRKNPHGYTKKNL
ncbi:Rps23 Pro-64 3,4-dihydroxylase Tpa1-like proline 4-hydroxylase [Flavobacteriaceae bacterium MAR_2010_72]|nr:Rps23 Pro-64 3,4-dihydroxylase Tpa1-like proline 4-hydroxylase [Flavobacteriaceae bacterium MAR_2010_72]TVZ59006.1 Rps23 Pro-64 3,4-dihydroxylase Tpa1-like proline 4-hydroxylase [Flavobacteriaceae bacterium MAR_2010_105]